MKKMNLTLKSGLNGIKLHRAWISSTCRQFGLNSEDSLHVMTAFDEALTNIARHTYKNRPGKISIDLVPYKNRLKIIISDWGKPFDAKRVKKQTPKEMIRKKKEGGLGMLLIERLMDKVKYLRRKDHNELVMIKYTGSKIP